MSLRRFSIRTEWVIAVCCAVMVSAIAVRAYVGVSRLGNLEAQDAWEGSLTAAAARMATAKPAAGWLDAVPHTLVPYGPGFYWTLNLSSRLHDTTPLVVHGRAISFVAAFYVAALAAAVVWFRTRAPELTCFAAVLVLSGPAMYPWSELGRVDVLGLALVTTAYVLLWRTRTAGAACFLVAATLVKQTFVVSAFPMVVFLWLRDRSVTMRFVAQLAAVGALVWSSLLLWYSEYFLRAGLVPVRGGFALENAVHHTGAFLRSPLGLSATLAAWGFVLLRPREAVSNLFLVGFAGSLVLGALLSTNQGSASNYFLEAEVLGVLLLVGVALPALSTANRGAVAMSIAAVSAYSGIVDVRSLAVATPRPAAPGYRAVAQLLAEHPSGYVIADPPWIDAVVASGRLPAVNDGYAYRLTAESGRVSLRPLTEAIAAGGVPLLLLSRPISEHRRLEGTTLQMWPSRVLDGFDRCFTLDREEPDLLVYRAARERPACGEWIESSRALAQR